MIGSATLRPADLRFLFFYELRDQGYHIRLLENILLKLGLIRTVSFLQFRNADFFRDHAELFMGIAVQELVL